MQLINMKNQVYLQIPTGSNISLTIQSIIDFIEGSNESGREVLINCIPIPMIVPSRLVSKDIASLKEAIVKSILNPDGWVRKPLTIAFVGRPEVIELDANRCIISA